MRIIPNQEVFWKNFEWFELYIKKQVEVATFQELLKNKKKRLENNC